MSATKLRAVVATWRPDIVRPNLQLSTFLNSLADHPKLTPQAVKAAESLRNNTAFKKYRLSEKTLKPASYPLHYTRLVEAFEKSAQGIARPWWKIFFNIW